MAERVRDQPGDALARLGLFGLAAERGRPDEAAVHALAALETSATPRATPLDRLVADALAGRLGDVMRELAHPRPAEERLLALAPARLPWRARLAWLRIAADVAARRGDIAGLAAIARRAGCPPAVTMWPPVPGSLPILDLPAEPGATRPSGPGGIDLAPVGCRVVVPATGRAGVIRLAVRIDPNKPHELALDHAGLAVVALGTVKHHHGDPLRHGPTWSRMPVPAGRGDEVIISLSGHGGEIELALTIVPDDPASGSHAEAVVATGQDASIAVALAYARGLAADVAGEVEDAQSAQDALDAHGTFALGQVLSGWLSERDVTLPGAVAVDRARARYERALAIDESLARAHLALSRLELGEGRAREAAGAAEAAMKAAPAWWPAALALVDAEVARDQDAMADRALDAALASVKHPGAGCPVLESALRRARRRHAREEDDLAVRLAACDARSSLPLETWRARGRKQEAADGYDRLARLVPSGAWAASEAAAILLGLGRPGVDARLAALGSRAPRDGRLHVAWADALFQSNQADKARDVLAKAEARLPLAEDVRHAARLADVPSPLGDLRVDGLAIVRAFVAANQSYDAPAVMVLDRSVERLAADGGRMVLTHNIVRVQSKDGIDRWGEIDVPPGAEVLTLRTIKSDLRVRDPEEILGKDTVSAPDLSPGDFVEWETLEYAEPLDAFAGVSTVGFLGSRFFFASFEAPLDRSEYLLVVPRDWHGKKGKLRFDRRAGAPAPVWSLRGSGEAMATFSIKGAPQVFAQGAAVPAVEWIPNVRASAHVDLPVWARYLEDRLLPLGRADLRVRRAAEDLRKRAGSRPLPEAIAAWVTKHIEPEGGLDVPASHALARGKGSRVAVALALAGVLGVPARLTFVRPLSVEPAGAPWRDATMETFAEPVLWLGKDTIIGAPGLKHAPVGYVPPALDGADAFTVGTAQMVRPRSRFSESRKVTLDVVLSADGSATVDAHEDLSGWAAIEWAAAIEAAAGDEDKLRKGFEERWLAHHFPGARLDHLGIESTAREDGRATISYTFGLAALAERQDDRLMIVPRFFRSEMGRRFASETGRRTPVQMGFDIPLELEARVSLPPGARVIAVGQVGRAEAGGSGGARFSEERQVIEARDHAPAQVVLRRTAEVPIVRLQPGAYAEASAALRRVDAIERSPITIRLPPQPALPPGDPR